MAEHSVLECSVVEVDLVICLEIRVLALQLVDHGLAVRRLDGELLLVLVHELAKLQEVLLIGLLAWLLRGVRYDRRLFDLVVVDDTQLLVTVKYSYDPLQFFLFIVARPHIILLIDKSLKQSVRLGGVV